MRRPERFGDHAPDATTCEAAGVLRAIIPAARRVGTDGECAEYGMLFSDKLTINAVRDRTTGNAHRGRE
jgi:hypothetical protein